MKNYLYIAFISFLLAACQQAKENTELLNDFFVNSTFEIEGLRKEPIDVLLKEVDEGKYGNVDRIFLVKNGKLVLDTLFRNDYKKISKGKSSPIGCGYNTCQDSTVFGEFNYYHPLWHPYYKDREVHTLQSITKSISSLLIGIAIDQGKIPSTDVPILDYLTDYDLSKVEDPLYKATLEHLLKMKLGMEWHEIGTPDTDPSNTTFMLEKSDDWIQYTLNQPMDTLPDTKWIYNSGGSQLMSVIIKKTTGLHLDEYAEKYLFEPLGIENYHWKKSPTGFPDALGGLYLEAEDLAKIGLLILKKGNWNGKQIVSTQWVEKSTSRLSDTTQVLDFGYGFQWWRPDKDGTDVIAGFGHGGQSLIIIPEFDLVAVTFSWNVFDEEVDDIRISIISHLIAANKSNAINK